MKKSIFNGQTGETTIVDMTAEEITELNTTRELIASEEEIYQNDKQAKEDLKTSAKAKLIAGEKLTEEEANTIVL